MDAKRKTLPDLEAHLSNWKIQYISMEVLKTVTKHQLIPSYILILFYPNCDRTFSIFDEYLNLSSNNIKQFIRFLPLIEKILFLADNFFLEK